MTTEEKKKDVEAFFKQAFAIDGTAELVGSKREIKRAFKILLNRYHGACVAFVSGALKKLGVFFERRAHFDRQTLRS